MGQDEFSIPLVPRPLGYNYFACPEAAEGLGRRKTAMTWKAGSAPKPRSQAEAKEPLPNLNGSEQSPGILP